ITVVGLLRNEIQCGIGNSQPESEPSFACSRKFPAVWIILPGLGIGALIFTFEKLKTDSSPRGPEIFVGPLSSTNFSVSRSAFIDLFPPCRTLMRRGGTNAFANLAG